MLIILGVPIISSVVFEQIIEVLIVIALSLSVSVSAVVVHKL